ncbi:MAG: hypothetical protein MK226_23745 [Saprospiraceae bacterium]|nr:hypothetical protein [Saprospiraceae bacterium]
MTDLNTSKLKLGFELLWWVLTLIILVVVLLPVYFSTIGYPFWNTNIIFIISFITLTRYIFLLKHTFLARQQLIKVILFFLCFPFAFYLIQEINSFQTFLDEEGATAIVGNIPNAANMMIYVRSELLLFGVGSIIASLIFPFRIILSVWRNRNTGAA